MTAQPYEAPPQQEGVSQDAETYAVNDAQRAEVIRSVVDEIAGLGDVALSDVVAYLTGKIAVLEGGEG